jgi:hypothetical protein
MSLLCGYLKAFLILSISCLDVSWKISLLVVNVATLINFTDDGFMLMDCLLYSIYLEYTVSPASTAHSSFVFLAWHVTLGIWFLSVLAKFISGPAFS